MIPIIRLILAAVTFGCITMIFALFTLLTWDWKRYKALMTKLDEALKAFGLGE